jgi:serine/threonine protein kinase
VVFQAPGTPSVGAGPAYQLLGLTLNNRWRVTELRSPSSDDTGGYFSVGYFAEDLDSPTNEEVFVKALDYSRWRELQFPSLADAMSYLTEGFRFERDIVMECADLRMRNVVKGFDSGSIEIAGFEIFNYVDFIVFEKAECDVRGRLRSVEAFDVAWKLHLLHNVAKGLQQLHQSKKAHLDLKPSNVLCFDESDLETMAKIGDLGRAHDASRSGPHSNVVFPGDRTYAPPEVLYGLNESDRILQTRQIDMYLLGSMMTFMFTGIGMTAGMLMFLDPSLLPNSWRGTYSEVLPYLREAYESHIAEIERTIPAAMRESLTLTIKELTDPDIAQRGHRKDPFGSRSRFSMEKYVSILNRLSRDADMKLRAELR